MPADHLIYGAPALAAAVDELQEHLGVRAAGGGQHQGRGTHNALLGLGEGCYLEIITPDPDQAAPSMPRPFGLDSLVHPRLVGWAVRCDTIDARVARARERGYDPGDAVNVQRTTTEGVTLRWRLTTKGLAGGLIPFLIDWGEAVHPSRSAPQGLTLRSLHLEHPTPASIAAALAALEAGVRVNRGPQPALVATIAGPRGTTELR
jgi:hypothetical protein